jgi:Ni,Fe-hydrogenase III large subunit
MSVVRDILQRAEAEICRPWLRHVLHPPEWTALIQAAAAESWILLGLWADTKQVHALFLNPQALTIVPVSTRVEARRYRALSPNLPGAAWYERMIRDLWGHEADGGTDRRPWLDHGAWPQVTPMSGPSAASPPPSGEAAAAPDAMLLPLGPIWGRLDEAAHLRLTLNGSSIRHAEARLGFTHKGTLTLMRGKSPRAAARFAARLSGDATVAHSTAFAQATEAAMDVAPPPRAVALRIVMQEIERIAGHLDNLAEVGRLADAPRVRSRCGRLREILLHASETAFGHRLMMDCVVPGGVAADIAAGTPEVILRALGQIASEMAPIRRLHEGAALSSRLSGIGRADGLLAASLAAGGIVGRASGRPFDARTTFASGYAGLSPQSAPFTGGDAAARQSLRIFEIEDSLHLVSTALELLPEGPVTVALPQVSGEGIACVESIRGDVWHWLRLDHGQIAAVFPRDPGWALWPLAECALANAAADDAALIRASLGLPASGMDL